VLRVSAESVLARVWAPATLTVASTVPVGFAINFLTSGAADWWWWLVLGTGTIAGIVGAVWTFFAQKERSGRAAPTGPGGGGQQTASDSGTNISINADKGSAAAYQMGEVNIGRPRRRGKRNEP
jgi:hypothetical protein